MQSFTYHTPLQQAYSFLSAVPQSFTNLPLRETLILTQTVGAGIHLEGSIKCIRIASVLQQVHTRIKVCIELVIARWAVVKSQILIPSFNRACI